MSLARKIVRKAADAMTAEMLAQKKKMPTHMGRDDALAHLEWAAKEIFLFSRGEYFIQSEAPHHSDPDLLYTLTLRKYETPSVVEEEAVYSARIP